MGVRKGTLLLTLMVFLGLIAFSFAASKVPPGVLKAAKEGLREFPMIRADLLGKKTEKPFSPARVALGEFFQVYTVNPVELIEAKALRRSFRSFIIPTTEWRVIVKVNGKPHSLLTIDKIDGKWKAVAWGGRELARELSALWKEWPSKDYRLKFVRIYQARADVVQILDKRGREKGYVPLISARIALNLTPKFDPLFTLSGREMLKNLRGIVKKELDLRK